MTNPKTLLKPANNYLTLVFFSAEKDVEFASDHTRRHKCAYTH